jgi:hypothetical protein
MYTALPVSCVVSQCPLCAGGHENKQEDTQRLQDILERSEEQRLQNWRQYFAHANRDRLGRLHSFGRTLDSTGGGHVIRNGKAIGNIIRDLDSIGGGNVVRGLDSIGGGNVVRDLDSIGGGNVVRNLDSIGGGNVVRGLDSIGGGNLVRNLDSIGGGNVVRGLDSIGGGNLVRGLDSIGGGNLVRNLD